MRAKIGGDRVRFSRRASSATFRRSIEHRPVETAVLDRLQQLRRGDFFRAGEVGDGAGNLEDAVVSPGGEAELLHGLLQQVAEGGVNHAMSADLGVGHAGVGGDAGAGKPCLLAGAGGVGAGADGRGRLSGQRRTQLRDRERRRIDVDVDTIQERAADAGAIALNLRGRAAALVSGVAEIAARTGVHGRDQHECARQRDFPGAA